MKNFIKIFVSATMLVSVPVSMSAVAAEVYMLMAAFPTKIAGKTLTTNTFQGTRNLTLKFDKTSAKTGAGTFIIDNGKPESFTWQLSFDSVCFTLTSLRITECDKLLPPYKDSVAFIDERTGRTNSYYSIK